jgi:hypothetical protein
MEVPTFVPWFCAIDFTTASGSGWSHIRGPQCVELRPPTSLGKVAYFEKLSFGHVVPNT